VNTNSAYCVGFMALPCRGQHGRLYVVI